MPRFELKFERNIDYNNSIELDIRLQIKPSAEDTKTILDAIDTLDTFANKYLIPRVKPVIKEKK